jgi:hypothetical protein
MTTQSTACRLGKNLPLNTLIVVLGLLAGVSMAGFIALSLNNAHSGDSLLGICLAIVGYLGGLLTPTTSQDDTGRQKA